MIGTAACYVTAKNGVPMFDNMLVRKDQNLKDQSEDMRVPNKFGEVNNHFWQRDMIHHSLATNKSPSALEIQVMKKKFNKIDTKNTGYIDKEEAAAAGISQERFKLYDRNQDGKISWEEYQRGAITAMK